MQHVTTKSRAGMSGTSLVSRRVGMRRVVTPAAWIQLHQVHLIWKRACASLAVISSSLGDGSGERLRVCGRCLQLEKSQRAYRASRRSDIMVICSGSFCGGLTSGSLSSSLTSGGLRNVSSSDADLEVKYSDTDSEKIESRDTCRKLL